MTADRKYDDPNITVDAEEDRFAWRRKIKANPTTRSIYRIFIGVLGFVIIGVGIALLPLPGPGWVIIFVGLGVWASEFEWAAKLLDFAKAKVKAWTEWVSHKPWWVKGLVGLATLAFVLAIFYLLFLVSGVPGFMPDFAEDKITQMPGLG